MTVSRVLEQAVYWAGGWRVVGEDSTGTILLDTDFDNYTVANPISNADMWDAVGGTVGNNTATFDEASIVDLGAPHNKVISHFNAAGLFIGSSPDPAGMSMFVPLSQSVDEATISYDLRFTTPDPVTATNPWGKGAKLPGLCGIAPGQGNPPSGGTSSQYGWSARGMAIAPGAGFGSESPRSPVEWVSYLYDPLQPTSSFGQNRRTGVGWLGTGGPANDAWVRVTQYHKMNTVTTDGVAWSANGIHRMYWDAGSGPVLVYEKTDQVYRKYTAGKITHWADDVYYGGADSSWAPTGDVNIEIDNLLITTP